MAVADTQVQVAPDSTGAKIDNSQVTRADTTSVNRQRVNLSDPSDPNAHAAVRGEAGRGQISIGAPELFAQLQTMNATLREMFEFLKDALQ